MLWLHNTRVLAIIAVVFLHVAAKVLIEESFNNSAWWIGNIYNSFVRWCVPVFVMISGALLLDPTKKDSLKTFYSKRATRILIPLLFWSTFYIFWAVFKAKIQNENIVINQLFESLLAGKPHYHMWFLYMILSLYLFAPFLRNLVNSLNTKELYILIIILFLFVAASDFLNSYKQKALTEFIFWFLHYIPYFLLGYFIKKDERTFSIKILATVFLSTVLLTALLCYLVSRSFDQELGKYFYNYTSITVIPMSISIMYILKKCDKSIANTDFTIKISGLTLGVYLIHPIFLEIFSYLGFSSTSFNALWSVPIVTIVATILSFASAYLISKIKFINRVI